MAFTPAPIPKTWTQANLNNASYIMSSQFDQDAVQVSLAVQINDGSINGNFTQAQFDAWYGATLGNNSLGSYYTQETAWHKILMVNGVGTQTGPAGTFNK